MRAMCGDDELDVRKGAEQIGYDRLLPSRMKVHIDFIDQHHSRALAWRGAAEVRIQLYAAIGNIGCQGNYVANTVAELADFQHAMYWMLQHQICEFTTVGKVSPSSL
ncbi:hypothetical protein D3C87_1030760 [compost metagenome]